jgi:pimeloyl-ACP methyl ester carboxylesterase
MGKTQWRFLALRLMPMLAVALALVGAARAADDAPQIELADAATGRKLSINAVAGCPNQSGILNSITVPVDQPLNLRVVVSVAAPAGGAVFNVRSDNPAFVAAGDRRQGFIPVVTIPAGATQSNPFTIFGISVGQTLLRLTPLTAGYSASTTPLGAWDINKSGSGSDQKFLDANDPAKSCRTPGSATLSTSATVQASCGKSVKGVASDGVNALLLRTVSGLGGTACFEIVSGGSLDQGTVQTPLTTTTAVSALNYGFSYFTPPAFYGDASASRSVQVEFSFTPNIGNGNTSKLRATLEVVRPPVVLVHGLWSGPDSWSSDFARNDAVRTSQTADYAANNGASFTTNKNAVKTAAAQALTSMRKKSYAATQVDVAGHSMGGLLTRLYADATDYKRPENFNKGDVHRLVTLDTPHFGSGFANLLVSLHNVNAATATKLETTVTGLTRGSILNGAVCDLAENSSGLTALSGGTTLRSQVITATGGPNGSAAAPARYWGGATVFGLNSFESALTETYCAEWAPPSGFEEIPVCLRTEFYFPQNIVNAFRFQEANDAVVTRSSQQGGLAGINYNNYIHFHIPGIPGVQRGITDGSDVATRVGQLFEGPDGDLAASLPGVPADGTGRPRVGGTASAAADYAAQCGPGGPMKPNARAQIKQAGSNVVDPRVRIVSPAAGTAITLGDPVTVVVELSPPLTSRNTVGVTFGGVQHTTATWTSGLRFTAVLPSSVLSSGALTLTPDFTDTAGNTFVGAPVVVGVRPASAPVALALQQRSFFEAPGAVPRQLVLSGTLLDGSVINLSSGFAGTQYSTSNPAVVTVGTDGLVSIGGPGIANVTAKLGLLSDVATFVVEDPANPLPPSSVASQLQFTASGFRLDRSTGFYVQELTVINNSTTTLVAPLYLVLKNLPAGVALVSKSGLTGVVAPLGSPYLVMPLPGDGLSLPPAGTVKFTLKFLNPDRVSISYGLDAVNSSSEP